MGEILVGIGLVSLVLGAWSGFALLAAVDKPALLRSMGVVDLHRVRQVHLDWIIMGAVAIATGLALPNLTTPLGILIAIGVVVNPATFIPMAFSRNAAQQRWFQAVSMASFIALTVGLTGATAFYILE
jgi:hypothetical protein